MLRKASFRRAFAATVAVAIHVVLFAGLVLGRRPDPLPVEPPTFDIVLEKRLPRPVAPPKLVRRTPPPEAIPPVFIPAPPPTPPISDADRAALAAAPFKGFPGVEAFLRARRSCLNGADTPGEADACVRLFGRGPVVALGLEDPKGGFALAARRKTAIVGYQAGGDIRSYSGLKCSLTGRCAPRPWEGPLPGEIID